MLLLVEDVMKKGFTLSEVLITLVVIGVVAAITVPVITVGHQQTETIARLKKALSVANQALQASTMYNGEVSSWYNASEIGLAKYMETYWHPYFRNIKVCTNYKTCGFDSNKPYKNPNGSAHGQTLVYNNVRVPFLTDDNMLYTVTPNDGTFILTVDINGANKPNKFGRDLFYLEYDTEGKSIRPYGWYATKEEIEQFCSKSNGTCCAAKIVRDSWQIKNGYPW